MLSTQELTILILFLISSIVAVAAKRFNLPYTVALMAVGLILGTIKIFQSPQINREILYAIFLPGLIFESAIHIKISDFFKNIWIILFLVIPGVVLSTILSAAALIFFASYIESLKEIDWNAALLFGAAVAATDPISVISIFKTLGAPKRLRLLIESESLLNDGTSIVIFLLLLNYIVNKNFSIDTMFTDFALIGGGGVLVGIVIGVFASYAMKNIDDPMIIITITTIAAYGSFLIADKMNLSGVMSTVATGLICGYRGFSNDIFPSIKIATETFWEYVSFALNSIIFLLMGFTIKLKILISLWPAIVLAYISVLISRAFLVILGWGIFYPTKSRIPFSWAAIIWWGGLRGALSMILALSIPDNFAFKDIIIAMVFGVVLLSIFIQGLTATTFLKALKIVPPKDELKEYELLKAKIAIIQNTIERLEELSQKRLIDPESFKELKNEYLKELETYTKKLGELKLKRADIANEEKKRVLRRALKEQKTKLLELYQNGTLSFDTYYKLLNEIDAKILEMETIG